MDPMELAKRLGTMKGQQSNIQSGLGMAMGIGEQAQREFAARAAEGRRAEAEANREAARQEQREKERQQDREERDAEKQAERDLRDTISQRQLDAVTGRHNDTMEWRRQQAQNRVVKPTKPMTPAEELRQEKARLEKERIDNALNSDDPMERMRVQDPQRYREIQSDRKKADTRKASDAAWGKRHSERDADWQKHHSERDADWQKHHDIRDSDWQKHEGHRDTDRQQGRDANHSEWDREHGIRHQDELDREARRRTEYDRHRGTMSADELLREQRHREEWDRQNGIHDAQWHEHHQTSVNDRPTPRTADPTAKIARAARAAHYETVKSITGQGHPVDLDGDEYKTLYDKLYKRHLELEQVAPKQSTPVTSGDHPGEPDEILKNSSWWSSFIGGGAGGTQSKGGKGGDGAFDQPDENADEAQGGKSPIQVDHYNNDVLHKMRPEPETLSENIDEPMSDDESEVSDGSDATFRSHTAGAQDSPSLRTDTYDPQHAEAPNDFGSYLKNRRQQFENDLKDLPDDIYQAIKGAPQHGETSSEGLPMMGGGNAYEDEWSKYQADPHYRLTPEEAHKKYGEKGGIERHPLLYPVADEGNPIGSIANRALMGSAGMAGAFNIADDVHPHGGMILGAAMGAQALKEAARRAVGITAKKAGGDVLSGLAEESGLGKVVSHREGPGGSSTVYDVPAPEGPVPESPLANKLPDLPEDVISKMQRDIQVLPGQHTKEARAAALERYQRAASMLENTDPADRVAWKAADDQYEAALADLKKATEEFDANDSRPAITEAEAVERAMIDQEASSKDYLHGVAMGEDADLQKLNIDPKSWKPDKMPSQEELSKLPDGMSQEEYDRQMQEHVRKREAEGWSDDDVYSANEDGIHPTGTVGHEGGPDLSDDAMRARRAALQGNLNNGTEGAPGVGDATPLEQKNIEAAMDSDNAAMPGVVQQSEGMRDAERRGLGVGVLDKTEDGTSFSGQKWPWPEQKTRPVGGAQLNAGPWPSKQMLDAAEEQKRAKMQKAFNLNDPEEVRNRLALEAQLDQDPTIGAGSPGVREQMYKTYTNKYDRQPQTPSIYNVFKPGETAVLGPSASDAPAIYAFPEMVSQLREPNARTMLAANKDVESMQQFTKWDRKSPEDLAAWLLSANYIDEKGAITTLGHAAGITPGGFSVTPDVLAAVEEMKGLHDQIFSDAVTAGKFKTNDYMPSFLDFVWNHEKELNDYKWMDGKKVLGSAWKPRNNMAAAANAGEEQSMSFKDAITGYIATMRKKLEMEDAVNYVKKNILPRYEGTKKQAAGLWFNAALQRPMPVESWIRANADRLGISDTNKDRARWLYNQVLGNVSSNLVGGNMSSALFIGTMGSINTVAQNSMKAIGKGIRTAIGEYGKTRGILEEMGVNAVRHTGLDKPTLRDKWMSLLWTPHDMAVNVTRGINWWAGMAEATEEAQRLGYTGDLFDRFIKSWALEKALKVHGAGSAIEDAWRFHDAGINWYTQFQRPVAAQAAFVKEMFNNKEYFPLFKYAMATGAAVTAFLGYKKLRNNSSTPIGKHPADRLLHFLPGYQTLTGAGGIAGGEEPLVEFLHGAGHALGMTNKEGSHEDSAAVDALLNATIPYGAYGMYKRLKRWTTPDEKKPTKRSAPVYNIGGGG